MVETDPPPPPPPLRPLDDVMLAMDVVDTLRHRETIVARELDSEGRDRALIEKLRQIYAAQGIDVPDDILAEGVEALKEDRFKYSPPEESFQVKLARVYVQRSRWLPPLFIGLAICAAIWAAYIVFVSGPRERRLAELPRLAAAQQEAIDAASNDPEAVERAAGFVADVKASLAEGDVDRAELALAELRQLRSDLEREYELRIVAEGSTGVWRIPDVNESARNYYIIVEPVGPDGSRLSLDVTSEETNQTSRVSKWGIRVDEATFNQIADDKQDDGIIQNNRFAVKRAGELEPEYLIPKAGGAITNW